MSLSAFAHVRNLLVTMTIALRLGACASVTPSPSSTPFHLPPATQTRFPSPARRLLTNTPIPTSTPQPTSTPILSTPTFVPTLTPATPVGSANQYRLKGWTDQEAWAAISEGIGIVTSAYSANRTDWRSPYGAIDFADYLISIEKETLFRFPHAANNLDVAWELAYRESANVNYLRAYQVGLFASLLEDGLNSGQVTLDSLSRDLSEKGFQVTTSQSANGIFGTQESATVLQIESVTFHPDLASTATLVILGSVAGNYHVIPVQDQWDFNYHNAKTLTVSDHNGNGRAEVQIIKDYWASGMPGACASHLSLYEWRDTYPARQFVDIARDAPDVVMSSDEGDCDRPWEFGPADLAGAQPLISTHRMYNPAGPECVAYEKWIRFDWSGGAYQASSAGITPFTGSTKCAVGWANLAGGTVGEAVSLLAAALDDWPTEVDTIWGPSAKDYFRFKLGTWYVLRDQTDLAIATLQAVRDNPSNPEFEMASQLAKLYLSRYQAEGVNAACTAVTETFIANAPTGGGGYDLEAIRTAWGFADPKWRFFRWDGLCEMKPAAQPPVSTPTPQAQSQLSQAQMIESIEQILFLSGDVAEAKRLLKALLAGEIIEPHYSGPESQEPDRVKPYLRYLLGLSYELSGDELNAVKIYWQLWHDYPENPYSLIVRRKLEQIFP